MALMLEGYESSAQAAERLGIVPSQVRRYCEQDRWPGAQKVAGRWFVPDGSKPTLSGFGRPPKWAKEEDDEE